MKKNKLLERQIHKFLPEELRNLESIRPFLEAVSNSFSAYERDAELSERAFRITEEEYQEINEQLKKEIKIKEASIAALRDAVSEIGAADLSEEDTELLPIATYLKEQISARVETEQQ